MLMVDKEYAKNVVDCGGGYAAGFYKLDLAGNLIWSKLLNIGDESRCAAMVAASNDEFYILEKSHLLIKTQSQARAKRCDH